MKRNNEKVPEFDEIIFENRNKTYGAYDLRKRYKSAASLSILGGITLSAIIMLSLSFKTKDGTTSPGIRSVVIVMSDPVIHETIKPSDLKAHANPTNTIKNLRPVVTDDSSEITLIIPTTEEILNTVPNGKISDTVQYTLTSDPVIPPETTTPYINVQEMPEFPGGLPALMKYVGDNLKYPDNAKNNNIEGKVILKFVVNTDGSVDRIEILRGIDPVLDNEAIRVVSILPRFKPGKQNGVPVPVWFMLPIVFKIENN